MLNENSFELTDREYKIMDVLWDSEHELTINEISQLSNDPVLNAPCVSQVMPRLLKKKIVHVEQFIQVNTKYARTFLPDINRQDYMESRLLQILQKVDIAPILRAILSQGHTEENETRVQELEKLVQDYRNGLL